MGNPAIRGPRAVIDELRSRLCLLVRGQERLMDRLLITLLCNGHLLLEGLPGTAKTRAIKVLAQALEASLGRIQFTPDLLPSDVTGTEQFHAEGQGESLCFVPGPIFNNLVLADEINRAPAKVQSALLEAMEERQVTVAGKTYPLPCLFMVLATQNPIEHEGTYPLPEAQVDRFLMKLSIDYPSDEVEREIIRLVREEEAPSASSLAPLPQALILEAREQVRQVYVSDAIDDYIVALVMATRDPRRISEQLVEWIEIGASPRASVALDRCARAHAWLQGREYVKPEDVRAVLADVLPHRIHLSYRAQAEGVTSERVLDEIVRQTAVV